MKTPVLNRKLVLEARSEVPDGAGGFSESWVALGTLWAAMRSGTGRDAEVAGLSLGRLTLRITVRAAASDAPSRPKAGQRFREGTRIYRIESVGEADAAGRYLTCFALEEVAV